MKISPYFGLLLGLLFVLSCDEENPFEPDTTPPIVSIQSPVSGQTVTEVVTISVLTQDNIDISKVEFFVDDSLHFTDLESPYEYDWNTLEVEDDNYVLKVISYDTSNNSTTCQPILVIVNNYDECGEVNGDNSTCLGCDDIPNSGLVNDDCGVCGGDNSTCLEGDTEIDVDWVLVKTPNFYQEFWDSESNENISLSGIGYYFYYTGSSNITDLNMIEYDNDDGSDYVIFNDGSNGILSFSYNNQDFSFDLSDSYDSSIERYGIRTIDERNSELELLQRIIYNQDLGYFTLFGPDGFYGIELNSSSPNELIDYR